MASLCRMISFVSVIWMPSFATVSVEKDFDNPANPPKSPRGQLTNEDLNLPEESSFSVDTRKTNAPNKAIYTPDNGGFGVGNKFDPTPRVSFLEFPFKINHTTLLQKEDEALPLEQRSMGQSSMRQSSMGQSSMGQSSMGHPLMGHPSNDDHVIYRLPNIIAHFSRQLSLARPQSGPKALPNVKRQPLDRIDQPNRWKGKLRPKYNNDIGLADVPILL